MLGGLGNVVGRNSFVDSSLDLHRFGGVEISSSVRLVVISSTLASSSTRRVLTDFATDGVGRTRFVEGDPLA